MIFKEIKYDKLNSFSKLLTDYSLNKSHFSDLITNYPSVGNFKNQISLKSKNYNNRFRKVLVNEIKNQYLGIELTPKQNLNIEKILDTNTFTVTTGHQLNLLTGPLYSIYKIISVINLTEVLEKNYSNNSFVPLYWMASEDHDFEEINNFYFEGKKFIWNSNQSGAVGNFKLNSTEKLFKEFEEYITKSKHGLEIYSIFKHCFLKSDNLSQATRRFVNKIFSRFGLIIIDANNKNFKSLFSKFLKKELSDKLIYKHSVESLDKLEKLNYRIQASPRKINLFYMKDKLRERIYSKDGDFYVKNSSIKWNLSEIKNEIDKFPERFSPNVLFRPIYQEYILPNICYVGGPAELAYWLELKSVFEHEKLTFPVILNRNSAMLIDKKTLKKLKKLDISLEELFLSEDLLEGLIVSRYSKLKLDFNKLKLKLKEQFSELKSIAKNTDKSFIGALNAQQKKQINGLKMLEKRLNKAEKRIHRDKINKALEIKKSLFPNGNLQERVINFSQFYKAEGSELIEKIKNNLDPLNQKFTIIEI